MRKSAVYGLAVMAVMSLAAAASQAQEAPELPKPEKEHLWLKQFVGEWTTTSKGFMGPDQPPLECTGTISGRMIGGFWVVNEMQAEVFGAPMLGIQTIGYDPKRKKYVGTWVDSMVNHMWRYEGSVDDTGKKLTLEAEGPNFMAADKITKFRDAYEIKSADHILITSSMLGDDGKWITFMTGDAKRRQEDSAPQ